MNLIVKKVDGRLVAELPRAFVEALGLAEGDVIDATPLIDGETAFRDALEAVVDDHREALRELAK